MNEKSPRQEFEEVMEACGMEQVPGTQPDITWEPAGSTTLYKVSIAVRRKIHITFEKMLDAVLKGIGFGVGWGLLEALLVLFK